MEAVSNSAVDVTLVTGGVSPFPIVTLSEFVTVVVTSVGFVAETVVAVTGGVTSDAVAVTEGVPLETVAVEGGFKPDSGAATIAVVEGAVVEVAVTLGVTFDTVDFPEENSLVTNDILDPEVAFVVVVTAFVDVITDDFVTVVTEGLVVLGAVTLATGVTKVLGASEIGVATGVVEVSFCCSDSKSSFSSSSSLSMTVASDSCDLKKYSFCCFKSFILCQAVDSSPQSSESYSESVAFSLSESDISTATRRAKILATSV